MWETYIIKGRLADGKFDCFSTVSHQLDHMVSRRPGHDHIDNQDDIIRSSDYHCPYYHTVGSRGHYQIIVHIVILLYHMVSRRPGHDLIDDQHISRYCWYMTIETAIKMVTTAMITIMMILLSKMAKMLMTTLRHLPHWWREFGLLAWVCQRLDLLPWQIWKRWGHYCGGTYCCACFFVDMLLGPRFPT